MSFKVKVPISTLSNAAMGIDVDFLFEPGFIVLVATVICLLVLAFALVIGLKACGCDKEKKKIRIEDNDDAVEEGLHQ